MPRLEYRCHRNQPHLDDVMTARMSRRTILQAAACGASSVLAGSLLAGDSDARSTLTFSEIHHAVEIDTDVADGYQTQVLLRWGDPILSASKPFDIDQLDADSQQTQFGYNNDFVAYLPLPRGSRSSDHGLLCVNHEYTNRELMFPTSLRNSAEAAIRKRIVDLEMASHGHSVVEIKRIDGKWQVIRGRYNRRISAWDTAMRISGPAAGHARLRGASNPTGYDVVGTLNNCAGGVTPWGTVLIAEENFHQYFAGDAALTCEAANHLDYGVGEPSEFFWSEFYHRFQIQHDPHGPNNYGWVVEFDPYDPTGRPVKRTALGRFRHEGATTAMAADGRLVVYSGDDSRGEYFYRFVTRNPCHPTNRWANRDLLDEGTLYVAVFHENATLEWRPLIYGRGPLTAENGFSSQADVVINTRRAADLVGATPMDRPEDAETNPQSGRV